ncbi:hypothetical protein [Hymenobacter persicinus]|uniref:Outer membrane protein beta-barrel domain-containing protein n=1 Tax=Hymenobacter persicinus TaxID=2025506 RepID=A0A4Q5LAJ3_9BACT|nr:hypothetical protein [Hymenobacter persicinus]RYU77926.1 hypothetical protein EWM57_16070 [Hymenobacter persicinus]
MPTAPHLCLLNRSLLGCGFLFSGFLPAAYAQRGPEISLGGGFSLAQPGLTRHNLPNNFRTTAAFNTGAVLRLTVPVRSWLGLGIEQRITGLPQMLAYRQDNSQLSTGLGSRTLYQYGLRAVVYDVWLPAPRWALDLALTGSYGLPLYGGSSFSGRLWHDAQDTRPTSTRPLVWVEDTRRAAVPMAGLEALLRFELGVRQALLLTATYQRGLRPAGIIRSTRVEYLDDAGNVQQGSFVARTRASYAALQLGYCVRFGAVDASRTRTLRTPRYGTPPEEDEPTNELGTDN